ncbi:MAG: hypothetical protein IBJ12_02555 [Sphingomonadaceae bacterium]|nr:hypothetical protein [Sphingomonadaceae bacterium]
MLAALIGLAAVAETVWITPEVRGYPESLIVAPDGVIILSVVFSGKIFARSADGSVRELASIPDLEEGQPGFVCVVRAEDGKLYASANRKRGEVWRIHEDGKPPVLLSTLPDVAQPNGITSDGHGGLILGDNFAGLWHVDIASGKARRWLEHPLLTRTEGGVIPAANGVQRLKNAIYVSNSDRGLLLRIPMDPTGKAGRPAIVGQNAPGDDFALANDGTAYVTTHPHNTVLKVQKGGKVSTFAGTAEGMYGPTAATIQKADGKSWLYVATDGDAFSNGGKPRIPPSIIRISLPEGR